MMEFVCLFRTFNRYCNDYYNDSDADNLKATAFSDIELIDILNRNNNAKKIIINMDACHSGMSGLSSERYAKRDIGIMEVNQKINDLAAKMSQTLKGGVTTFSASSSDGFSLEDSEWEGGVFTYCLVNGLMGDANVNGDEWVSLEEIDSYLTRKVLTLTEGRQMPKVNGTLPGDHPLSKVR